MAGATTKSRSCPLLSLAASAIIAISPADADASGVDTRPDAANPPSPSPSPTITPLMLRMRFNWLSAGCRMLNSTHAMAGIIGIKSANPRLSPSAISAICWAAKAASQLLRVENKAPAIAVPAIELDMAFSVAGFLEARPFGRF